MADYVEGYWLHNFLGQICPAHKHVSKVKGTNRHCLVEESTLKYVCFGCTFPLLLKLF
jgi:hypothetical protein